MIWNLVWKKYFQCQWCHWSQMVFGVRQPQIVNDLLNQVWLHYVYGSIRTPLGVSSKEIMDVPFNSYSWLCLLQLLNYLIYFPLIRSYNDKITSIEYIHVFVAIKYTFIDVWHFESQIIHDIILLILVPYPSILIMYVNISINFHAVFLLLIPFQLQPHHYSQIEVLI